MTDMVGAVLAAVDESFAVGGADDTGFWLSATTW
jgi:hypothetical protein